LYNVSTGGRRAWLLDFTELASLCLSKIPVPEIDHEDILMSVRAAGLCGSDLHIIAGGTPTGFSPIPLGHEFAGVVVKVGDRVRQWENGVRAVLVWLGQESLKIIPPNLFVRSEVELIGSYAFDRTDIQSVVDLAASGKFNLSPSVRRTFPFSEVNEALRYLRDKVGNPVRIVVTP
jgi:threonine dehydrogenase-like Zn-dependent dehydrogenase